jgi:hypothetical protein
MPTQPPRNRNSKQIPNTETGAFSCRGWPENSKFEIRNPKSAAYIAVGLGRFGVGSNTEDSGIGAGGGGAMDT